VQFVCDNLINDEKRALCVVWWVSWTLWTIWKALTNQLSVALRQRKWGKPVCMIRRKGLEILMQWQWERFERRLVCWQRQEMSADLHTDCTAGDQAECRWSAPTCESVESEDDWRGSWRCWWSLWRHNHGDVPGYLSASSSTLYHVKYWLSY